MHSIAWESVCTRRSLAIYISHVRTCCMHVGDDRFVHTQCRQARFTSSCRGHSELQNAVLLAPFGAPTCKNGSTLCLASPPHAHKHATTRKLQNARSYATLHQTRQATRRFAAKHVFFKIASPALCATQRPECALALFDTGR